MKRTFQSLRLIFGWNTIISSALAVGGTYISLQNGWTMDIPLTIIGIAVVFPIVFSIGGAYTRREAALTQYAHIKGIGRSLYFGARDWLRDKGPKATKNKNNFKKNLGDLMATIRELFQTETSAERDTKEKEVYTIFSKLSKDIEDLRDRGLSGSEVSRMSSHISRMLMAFENVKHIYQYRTPRTLRSYSKLFVYVGPLVYSPYFAFLGEGKELWLVFLMPALFAVLFTCLDNIQDHLENPFDQVGEDDIKINAEKFTKSLEL